MSAIDHFLALGMAPEDARSRADGVDRVGRGFLEAIGGPAAWTWFVPGRIELVGKHTDYAGGRSLLAAVPRGFAVAAGPRADGIVRAIDLADGARADIDPADDAHTRRGWSSYVQVVARRFARNFPGAALGLDLVFASDLPRAAGLSSSSALVVAVATALATRARLADREEWQAHIRSVEDAASYYGCVENGMDFGGLPGSAGVGTHGGSEDHTAILACRSGHVSQFRFVPSTRLDDTALPSRWSFVVASSGVHADKAGSVRDRFNRASLATRALLECWNHAAPVPARSLGAALTEPGALHELERLVGARSQGDFTVSELLNRLAHFVAEDALAPEAARACALADASAMGRLAQLSQQHAEAWLGNQVPETAALAALARECGAMAATSFGAGFGGSVWALVDADESGRFAREWLTAYARRYADRRNVAWFVARPGPPATQIDVPHTRAG